MDLHSKTHSTLQEKASLQSFAQALNIAVFTAKPCSKQIRSLGFLSIMFISCPISAMPTAVSLMTVYLPFAVFAERVRKSF